MKVQRDEEYSFGPYRLDVTECRFWRGTDEIKLRPKLFSLLLVFLQHQGKMIEKEELIRSLWPDSVVEDSNLTVNVNALRTILSDGIYIETVSKRGYRFVPEVRIVRRDSAHLQSVTDPADLIETPGGALPLHSHLYISRPADDRFCHAITRHDSIVLIKGARQVGKTSLLARGLEAARLLGATVLMIDLQHFGKAAFESSERLLSGMAELIAHQIDLTAPDHTWNARLSAGTNFERFLRRDVLASNEEYFVLALDEVDRLFAHDYASEIFGLFRSWHNLRALDPNGLWNRLTIAIAYATEAHLFITDLNQSPFNVGTRLMLEDFTPEQMAELNGRYGNPLADEAELRRFQQLIGGHPYLAQRGLYEIQEQKYDAMGLEQNADRENGPFGDHLRRLLISLQQDQDLLRELRGFLLSDSKLSNAAFYRLRSAGVLAGETVDEPRPRCDLYARYLKRHLT
jgi:DNA-binding winged helix-turn-helix (wHTH) protein